MGLLGSLFGEDTGDKLLRAMAIRNKDYGAAAAISGDIRERKQGRLDAEEAKKVEAELIGLLEDEFMTQGYGPEDARRQARLAILNAKEVGSNVSSRLGAKTMGPEQTLMFGRKPQYTTPESTPAPIREAQAFNALPPDQQRGVASALDVTRGPAMKTDAYGRLIPVPRSSFLPAPRPGTVDDGYRFKGGDPANPNNWEPVDQVGGEILPIPRLGGR